MYFYLTYKGNLHRIRYNANCLKAINVISISYNKIYKNFPKNAKRSAIVTFQGASPRSVLPYGIHGHCLRRAILYTALYNYFI